MGNDYKRVSDMAWVFESHLNPEGTMFRLFF
jgi:hypothetical protein